MSKPHSKHRPASINDSFDEPLQPIKRRPRKPKEPGKSLIELMKEKRQEENIPFRFGNETDEELNILSDDGENSADDFLQNGDSGPEIESPVRSPHQYAPPPVYNNTPPTYNDATQNTPLPPIQKRLVKFKKPVPRESRTPDSMGEVTPSTVLNMSRDEATPSPDYKTQPYHASPYNPDDAGNLEKSDNWQEGKTLAECNNYMLTYEIGCDVTYLVGDQEEAVMAHSYVLMSRSVKFFNQLNKLSNQMNKLININDVEAHTFRSLLSFIYTDEVDLDVKMAIALIPAAEKYGPATLKLKCFDFLMSELSSDSACLILESAHKYQERNIYDRCLHFIYVNAEDVLKAANLRDLCKECVDGITKSDALNASEFAVYKGLIIWANGECTRRKLQPNDKNRREVLGNLLYNVRFPSMNVTEFTQKLSLSPILLPDEKIVLYQYFHGQTQQLPEHFNPKTRKLYVVRDNIDPQYSDGRLSNGRSSRDIQFNRDDPFTERYDDDFVPAVQETNQPVKRVIRFKAIGGSWQLKGPDAISFRSSKAVVVHGVQIFGPYKGTDSYTVTFTMYDDRKNEIRHEDISVFAEKSKVYDVRLRDPIRLPADRTFTVQTMIKGQPTIRGIDGSTSVFVDGIKFEFSNSNKSLNGTDVTMGQIPVLLFSKI